MNSPRLILEAATSLEVAMFVHGLFRKEPKSNELKPLRRALLEACGCPANALDDVLDLYSEIVACKANEATKIFEDQVRATEQTKAVIARAAS
jgi:hypothetical protein